ncbi:copper chaperone PCu(A)C [Caulobacter sp. S45]|uniref:copper chaperone PCu(A)C n=1 Tax=Caulobacter sp. S45 TaxID=1641861 RepID=UPI00131C441C|nr:copper chaperone PCu(A)C [Caulobacter sp. S45]
MRLFLGAALALPVAFASLASANAAAPTPAVSVSNAWSRPALPGMSTGVIYLTVTNHAAKPISLMGGSTPVAATMGLHRSAMSGGVSTMEMVDEGLEIPAGGTVKLEPNGYHMMLMGLKGGLKAGTSFPAMLGFGPAGSTKITVQVRATPPE